MLAILSLVVFPSEFHWRLWDYFITLSTTMKRESVGRIIYFLIIASIAAGAAAKPPKNFRRRPKPAAAEVEASTQTAKPRPARLFAGRWTPEARAALEGFIAARGKGAPGYDAAKPPVAVLPWSDALVAGDPAELVFMRLVSGAELKLDDALWEVVPVAYGRQPARAAYEQFVHVASVTWQAQPSYHRFRKEMLSSYIGLCRGVGRKECRSYLARLWAGWKEADAEEYARAALAQEKSRPASIELVKAEEGDAEPLKLRRGLRLLPHMRDLVSKLRAAGVDVWVVDDVPQQVLLASASDYGVDPSRVAGILSVPDGARMSANVLKPVPTRGGKAEIVRKALGRPADLVFGRDAADLDLMNDGAGVRVVLSGDPALEKAAAERGWVLQPALAR
jgi:phosphoserine phosphatase